MLRWVVSRQSSLATAVTKREDWSWMRRGSLSQRLHIWRKPLDHDSICDTFYHPSALLFPLLTLVRAKVVLPSISRTWLHAHLSLSPPKLPFSMQKLEWSLLKAAAGRQMRKREKEKLPKPHSLRPPSAVTPTWSGQGLLDPILSLSLSLSVSETRLWKHKCALWDLPLNPFRFTAISSSEQL